MRLLAKEEIPDFGELRNGTMRMFSNTEKRFGRSERRYIEFMKTYAELFHMEEIKETNTKSTRTYHLSHHAMVKKIDPENTSDI